MAVLFSIWYLGDSKSGVLYIRSCKSSNLHIRRGIKLHKHKDDHLMSFQVMIVPIPALTHPTNLLEKSSHFSLWNPKNPTIYKNIIITNIFYLPYILFFSHVVRGMNLTTWLQNFPVSGLMPMIEVPVKTNSGFHGRRINFMIIVHLVVIS